MKVTLTMSSGARVERVDDQHASIADTELKTNNLSWEDGDLNELLRRTDMTMSI